MPKGDVQVSSVLTGDSEVANVRWGSLSKSRKSLIIRVLDQLLFVPLRGLDSVLKGTRNRTVSSNELSTRRKNWWRKSGRINPRAIRTRKFCKRKETEGLKYNLCSACPKSCAYDVELVVFFPQEVEKGLHKMFPFKVRRNNGLTFRCFDDLCPHFRNGLCEPHGTDYMPIDCLIYPVTPISHKADFIDENCLLRNEFQNDKQYIKRCLKKSTMYPKIS